MIGLFKQLRYRPGDLVVYRKTKHSPDPGPRAADVVPSRYGEDYVYTVDKFWVVDDVTDDGRLLLRTRRGKTHLTRPDDPNLRHAGILTRLLHGDRFPSTESTAAASQDAADGATG